MSEFNELVTPIRKAIAMMIFTIAYFRGWDCRQLIFWGIVSI